MSTSSAEPIRDFENCDRCNYDMHHCPACGVSLPHGMGVCEDCREDKR